MNREIISAKAIISDKAVTHEKAMASDKPTERNDTLPPENAPPEEEVVTPKEARQGPLGKPILLVLVFSLALCALYLAGLMIWSAIDDYYFRALP